MITDCVPEKTPVSLRNRSFSFNQGRSPLITGQNFSIRVFIKNII
ncbi:MAG: hypothetical protein ACRC2J_08485 [Microcoleaceae cyanobacterium]